MPSFSKVVLALVFAAAAVAAPMPQLHGEGVALDALFTDTDNGVGYGIENAEENLAANIASFRGTAAPAPAGPGSRRRSLRARQADKISNGLQAVGESLGMGDKTSSLTNGLDEIDGETTDGAANLGTDLGTMEEGMLVSTGKAVPKL